MERIPRLADAVRPCERVGGPARGRHDVQGSSARGLALAALVAAASACSGGGGGGSDGGGGGPGPGPGGGELPEGSTVAVLETVASSESQFLLHGTFPVPPGTYPRSDGKQPFAVRDFDGITLLETQTEVVTRYPKDADGADVVEVVARVTRDPGVTPGTRVTYGVVSSVHDSQPAPGTPDVDDLRDGPFLVPGSVRTLLADPNAIRIAAWDCYGNMYTCFPLDGTGFARLERYGEAQATLRVYQTLAPDPPVTGTSHDTLPHSLGVHAYLSTMREEEVIGLDLRFHNGHSGRDGASPLDDPLDTVYFERLEVGIPKSWRLRQDYEDPFFGADFEQGNYRHFPIVDALPGGAMHVLRWQGQFHRRLALAPAGLESRAVAVLEQEGLAFSRRGTDPGQGHQYYSWWNLGTARWFPQRIQLPLLDHVGLQSIRNTLANEHNTLKGHMLNGTGTGSYPIASGVLGWGHPYGTPYGGMTGGNEIFVCDGIQTAVSGSREGYRLTSLTLRMHTDRQPMAFYNLDGSPTSVEDWLVQAPNPANDYVPFEHYQSPKLGPGDPFGHSAAPKHQINYVNGLGLEPPYQADHMSYDAHDYQHFIRYTRSAKVLAWLGNDPLAKDDLLMQAENTNLSYHQFKNSQFGSIQMSGLRADREYVDTYPGTGFTFGRGEAWSLDCAVAAFSLADPAWRAAKRPWLEYLAEVLGDGQASCSGFVQANIAPKFVNGLYRARQQIEQSIMETAFRGMIESVFRGQDSARTSLMTQVLKDSLNASVSDMAWYPGELGPWQYTAVGPLDLNLPVWCSKSQIPANGYTPTLETYQNWSSFAYGYEITGNVKFLNYASTQAQTSNGIGPLLTKLKSQNLNNIENRAALLSLLQRENGEL